MISDILIEPSIQNLFSVVNISEDQMTWLNIGSLHFSSQTTLLLGKPNPRS